MAGLVVIMSVAASAAANPIGIGILAPEGNVIGHGMVNAAELAATQINANGGINGRKIRLFVYDTHYSTSDAALEFQRAVEQDHAVAVVGIYTTEMAAAMMPWAARLKTPLLITTSSSPNISQLVRKDPGRFKYVFQTFNNAHELALQSCIQIRHLRSHPQFAGFDKAVILAEDLAWSKYAVQTYDQCLPKNGVTIVGTIRYDKSTKDFAPIFEKIEKDHPNMIVTAMAVTGLRPVIEWHDLKFPALLIGINAQSTASSFWKASNGATNDVISQNVAFEGVPITSKTAAFYDAYRKKFDVVSPIVSAYSTYDAMSMLFDALRRTNGSGGEPLVNALAAVDIVGTTGRLRFHGLKSKNAHETYFSADPKEGQSFVGFQWQDGKQVVIFPKRLATGHIQIPSFVPIPKK